jgi:N-hydroxyarylamine O-acetyltransferase
VLTASVLELPSLSRPTPFGPDHGVDRLGPQQLEALLKLLRVRPEPPSVPFLIRLQRSFLRTVPFENLDIAWGIPLQLDVAGAWSKVVERRRGGFCYELNTLLGWALLQLGFDVSLLSARVWRKAQRSWGPEFDHLALQVRVGSEDFLAEVGFGEAFRAPLRLPAGTTTDVSGAYRLVPDEADLQLLTSVNGGAWRPVYRLSLQPRTLSEFAGMFAWHQTSPESPFTTHTVFTVARPWGRITLTDRYRMETRGGVTTRRKYPRPGAWLGELRQRFGVRGPLGTVHG